MTRCADLWSVLLLATIFNCATFFCNGAKTKVAGPPPNALFVFGDSYVDTGNHNKTSYIINRPWFPPYGNTYPGVPTGRDSDGRVFTDVFAEALNMPSPIPYEQRLEDPSAPKYGMNFATGGAGCLNPYGMLSLSGQVDQMEFLTQNLYPKEFIALSVVLVGISGNDYGAYLAGGNPVSGIPALEKLVIFQMDLNIQRLYKLGFKTFYINNIEPMGCLPSGTRPDFKACTDISNGVAVQHNQRLQSMVVALRKQLPGSTFTILDLNKAFTTVLQHPLKYGLSVQPLVPCCLGAENALHSCGEFDSTGKPLFTVCANPSQSFFWDTNHPSQAGWIAVIKVLFPGTVINSKIISQRL